MPKYQYLTLPIATKLIVLLISQKDYELVKQKVCQDNRRKGEKTALSIVAAEAFCVLITTRGSHSQSKVQKHHFSVSMFRRQIRYQSQCQSEPYRR